MITFLGDVSLFESGMSSTYKPLGEYVFNCEYVIGEKAKAQPYPGKINLIGSQCNFEEIFGKAPIAVCISNNHINDYGKTGLKSTIENLTRHNIKISSAEILKLNTISLVSVMDIETSNKDDEQFLAKNNEIAEIIVRAKNADSNKKIVVMIHWGIENNPMPTKEQRDMGHRLIDAGADLVIGHHPHCIQPVESYKGKYIFYSLGNTLFPNINQPSHYDENGLPKRIYRFKWQSWNRKSLAVDFDEETGNVMVSELRQCKNTLRLVNRNIKLDKYMYKGKNKKFIYYIRKYWLFFASNVFVDGKLFDISALKSEALK